MYIFKEGRLPELHLVWNKRYFLAALLFSLVELFIFWISNFYKLQYRKRQTRLAMLRLLELGFIAIIFLYAFLYVTRIVDFSRIAVALYYVVSSVLLLGKRVIIGLVLKREREKGYNQKHVVVVGNGKHALDYIQSVNRHKELGYTIDGYVSKTQKEELGRCLGTYEDLEQILTDPSIDEVMVALESHEAEFMKGIINACDKSGVKVCIIPFFNDYIPAHPSIDVIGSTKIINIRDIPLDDVQNAFAKRLGDILFSAIILILTSPILIIVAILIKLSSPGPIIFKQERIGLNKRPFYMYKFRSMKLNDESNTAWSTNTDDRRTKIGSFIRKFSIDEFPQFFNVLKGDMSIVGPRPEIPHYVDQFKEEVPLYLVRQKVRPGITGLAQVNGFRGDTSIEGRVEQDIAYIENWTLWLDIKIIFRTIFGGMINSEKLS